jgi:hypothetical protein
MALDTYTDQEIQDKVLERVNKIKGLSVDFDSDEAKDSYEEAVRECGFEVPTADDADKNMKQLWLMKRMHRFFMMRLFEQYSLRFSVDQMSADQIPKTLLNAIKYMDQEFEKAKEVLDLFSSLTDVFGDSSFVFGPGFVTDRIGQDIETRVSD